jgi:hypothetical protein
MDIKSADNGTDGVDLMPCLVPNYLSSVLYDPKSGKDSNGTSSYDSDYLVSQDDSGRITVTANHPELGQDISVTR